MRDKTDRDKRRERERCETISRREMKQDSEERREMRQDRYNETSKGKREGREEIIEMSQDR